MSPPLVLREPGSPLILSLSKDVSGSPLSPTPKLIRQQAAAELANLIADDKAGRRLMAEDSDSGGLTVGEGEPMLSPHFHKKG